MSAPVELEIPKFLRRKPEPKRGRRSPPVRQPGAEDAPSAAREPQKLERVWLTDVVRLAETTAEESGMMLDAGILPRRWYRGDPDGEEVASLHIRVSAARFKKQQKEEKAEIREAKTEAKLARYAGKRTLEEILVGMKNVTYSPPDLATAKRATRHLPRDKWWFAADIIDKVRQAIKEYKPGQGRAAAKIEDVDRSATMTFGGKNPKKSGTDAHGRWETLKSYSGRTVGEYLADRGSNPTTLKNAIKSGHVLLATVARETEAEPATPEKPRRRTAGRAERKPRSGRTISARKRRAPS